jgi:pyruvate dehydrogenase E1 component alpha subunit
VIQELGPVRLLDGLRQMLLIRNLETRGEAAYQQGKVGGFYHSYAGQEAIQTACIAACGVDHWYVTTYRCHALALLLGVTPNEIMAELYGRVTGNAKGRGGSMHLFAERMMGGLAIVGGHVPLAVGAAFTIKYLKQKNLAAFCFLGDGAVAQGAFHESLNLAVLWKLPCVIVIENNQWGMGTAVERAIAVKQMGERFGVCYGIKSYILDGMDFLECYAGFKEILKETIQYSKPVLVEVVVERFRGHSISDPGFYRSKESLQNIMERDPISLLKDELMKRGMLTEEKFKEMDKEEREKVLASMKFADESPWPDPITLEEGVMAP